MAICPSCKTTIGHTHSIEDPIWINDPVKTTFGLNREDYKGSHCVSYPMIQQLQIYYNNLMISAGVVPPTWITNSQSKGMGQIEQLRICVELLLSNSGLTLTDYFNSDKYGNTFTPPSQAEWTDIDRTIDGGPRLPKNCPIKAIHIEELRRGLVVGGLWHESWDPATLSDSFSMADQRIAGTGANIPAIWHTNVGTINGDHSWEYDFKCITRIGHGVNLATIDSSILVGPSFNYHGYAKGDPVGALCTGYVYVPFMCFSEYIRGVIASINKNILIPNLSLSYSRSSGAYRGEAGTAPMPSFCISVIFGDYPKTTIEYWFGGPSPWALDIYPWPYYITTAKHPIIIANEPTYNGNFQRNVHNDYTNLPPFINKEINPNIRRINVFMVVWGLGVDTYYAPRNTWWSSGTLDVAFDDIYIKNIIE